MSDSRTRLEPVHHGRLEVTSAPELVWSLCREGRTGVLRVDCDPSTKSLYLEGGRVVFARSEDPDDRIGELLLQRRWVTLDALDAALSRQRAAAEPRPRVGELLVESGRLEQAQLADAVRAQIRAIVLDVCARERGRWAFHPGPLPSDEPLKLLTPSHELVLQAARHGRTLARIRQAVGGTGTSFRLADDWREALAGHALDSTESRLLDRLTHGPQSVESLGREVGLSDYETLTLLWGFKILGAIVAQGAPAPRAASMLDLLVDLGNDRATGVLRATRDGVERAFHLRDGRCTAASSTDGDDGLLARLVRRGMLRLDEADRVAERIEACTGLGSALVETGILEAHELDDELRRQLVDLASDTLNWNSAELRFVPGSIPSVDGPERPESIESLVREGLRRINAWSRVREGCGDLDVPVTLAPGYRRVLEEMQAGLEEWQLVAALERPATPRELCTALRLGTFRVCQMVWTLSALGALERVAVGPRPDAPAEAATAAEPAQPQAVVAPTCEPSADSPPADTTPADPTPAAVEPVLATPVAAAPAADDGTSTVRLSREEVERAIDAAPAALSEWIEHFNTTQRLIYRFARAEVGAGAANLLRASCLDVSGNVPPALHGAELQADGAWDATALRTAVEDGAIEAPAEEYERIVRAQLDRLRRHFGPRRLAALEQQLERLAASELVSV